jgi:hypothetical protein
MTQNASFDTGTTFNQSTTPYPELVKSKHLLMAIVEGKMIQTMVNGEWVDLRNPLESIAMGFIAKLRVKPDVIQINGHDVAVPEQEPLPLDTIYYVPDLSNPVKTGCVRVLRWKGSVNDYDNLNSGLIHLNPANALKHTQAILSLTKLKHKVSRD